jgi:hypothetical protein
MSTHEKKTDSRAHACNEIVQRKNRNTNVSAQLHMRGKYGHTMCVTKRVSEEKPEIQVQVVLETRWALGAKVFSSSART